MPRAMPAPRRPFFRRLPLLEVLVALAVFALLAGVVGLRRDAARTSRAAAQLEDLVAATARAAESHRADTGAFAEERERTAPASRRALSVAQPVEGWDGPYLARPLVDGQSNPYGRARVVGELSLDAFFAGFDTDGDGVADRTGDGNALVLWAVPRAVAAELDRTLDHGVPGEWAATGRVVHQADRGRTLVLLTAE